MKKLLIVFLFLVCVMPLLAAQKVVVVPCERGEPQTRKLRDELEQGWKVIHATPVQNHNAYTTSIVYILEK